MRQGAIKNLVVLTAALGIGAGIIGLVKHPVSKKSLTESRVEQSATTSQVPEVAETGLAADEQGGGGGGNGSGGGRNNKWQDPGIYVDGEPLGMLTFAELPISLKPIWRDSRVSAEINPGEKSSGYTITKERSYRFVDLLRSLGVDPAKIKQIHVYGPRFSDSIVASGAELQKHPDFGFRFAGNVSGKPLPIVPYGFGNRRSPDKITAVMVYVHKIPPRLIWNEGFELNGELQTDVPYYGEPLRGGIHVYQDDRLAAVIKRQDLRAAQPIETKGTDSHQSWRLADVLQQEGIDASRVGEIWIIHGAARTAKFTATELRDLTIEMGRSGAEILIGKDKIPANALALHRNPLRAEQLPTILATEQF